MSWIGSREVAFVLADVRGLEQAIPPPPADWGEQARRRIFFDPDATSGVDRSLRAYIRAVSYGTARLTGEVYGPYIVPWDAGGCAWTAGNAISAAGRPDPNNADNRATLRAQGSITGYSYAC